MPIKRTCAALVGAAVLALLATSCGSQNTGSGASTLTVFAAASLRQPFEQLSRTFERDNPGIDVVLVFAGSPTLARQLIDGADADVFASADPSHLHRVDNRGLTATAPTDFATNQVQAVRSVNSPVTSVTDFANDAYFISLCAPVVPCGRSGDALLRQLDIAVPNASQEADVLAVASKVASGEADAGIVYRSDIVQSNGKLQPILTPATTPVVSIYQMAALTAAEDRALAQAWIALILGPVGQTTLQDAGFGSVEAKRSGARRA